MCTFCAGFPDLQEPGVFPSGQVSFAPCSAGVVSSCSSDLWGDCRSSRLAPLRGIVSSSPCTWQGCARGPGSQARADRAVTTRPQWAGVATSNVQPQKRRQPLPPTLPSYRLDPAAQVTAPEARGEVWGGSGSWAWGSREAIRCKSCECLCLFHHLYAWG